MIVNDELKGMWYRKVVAYFRHYPRIFLQGPRKELLDSLVNFVQRILAKVCRIYSYSRTVSFVYYFVAGIRVEIRYHEQLNAEQEC